MSAGNFAFLLPVNNFILILFQLTFNHLFHQIDGYIHVVADLFRNG